MTRWAIVAVGAALLGATPLAAKTLNKLPAKLDPARAYVLVEIGNLDDEKQKGRLTFARYDAAARDLARPADAKPATPPLREVTAKELLRNDKRRLYLIELTPGEWVVEGANGTAFSLGANTFTAEPGSLTDLGVASVTTDYAEGEGAYKLTAGKALKLGLLGGFAGSAMPQPVPKAVSFRPRAAADLAAPRLGERAWTPVAWGGEVKFGNYLGGLVNRMGGRKARPGAAAVPAAAGESSSGD